jgi:hypothetical protein
MQQTYVFEFRLRTREEPRRAAAEPKFFVGVMNGIMLSLPLWVAIAWGVHALIS